MFVKAKTLSLATKLWAVVLASVAVIVHFFGVSVDGGMVGLLCGVIVGAYGPVDYSLIQETLMQKEKKDEPSK